MTRNPSVLRTSVSEDAEPLWKDLLIAGMAHEKAVEDWKPYCEPGADEGSLHLCAREEVDSSPLGKDDPEAHTEEAARRTFSPLGGKAGGVFAGLRRGDQLRLGESAVVLIFGGSHKG
jgi:hypothetical protein